MEKYLAGFDIGGTKCAVILGKSVADSAPQIIAKERFATNDHPEPAECLLYM